jgi:hypothetical protein
MKERRPHLSQAISPLESLDERIVPSAVGPNPLRQAALVGHASAHAAALHGSASGPVRHAPASHPQGHNARPLPGGPSPAKSVATASPAPVTTGDATTSTTSTSATTTTNAENPALAKVGQELTTLYEQQGNDMAVSALSKLIEIQGTNVGVDVHMSGGNFSTFVSSLTNMGMQVRASDAATGTVEGLLPISQILDAAQDAQTLSISPIYLPTTSASATRL